MTFSYYEVYDNAPLPLDKFMAVIKQSTIEQK